ncbi:MAG: EAL domain-containing protein, partial [Pseudomonadota bacterium]
IERGVLSGSVAERLATAVTSLATAQRTLAASQAESPPEATPSSQQGQGILYLLEDDSDQASLLMAQLAAHGYRISHFDSVKGLREACARQVPGAIIADIMLPEGERAGIEGITALHADLRDPPPVVFISALRDSKTRLAALRAGGRGYFSKPIDYTALLLQLDELLQHTETHEAQRVLVVDDDPDCLALVEEIARDAGFVSRSVTDPLAVIDAMYEFQPHVVVMDILMPEASGVEVARFLRQESQFIQTPILFVSADRKGDRRLQDFGGGHYDWLEKPLDRARLQGLLKARAADSERRFQAQQFLLQVDPATGFYQGEYFSQYVEAVLELEDNQEAGHWLACLRLTPAGADPRAWENRHHRAVFGGEVRGASAAVGESLLGASGPWECLLFFQSPRAHQVIAGCQTLRDQIRTALSQRLPGLGPWACGIGVVRWSEGTVPQLQHQASNLATLAYQEANGVRLSDLVTAQAMTERDHAYWRRELKHCIEERRLFFLFQPVANFMGDNIERYGALLRLRSSAGEVMLPELFLMQADIRGMFPLINCWVVAKALHQIGRQAQKGVVTALFVSLSRHSIGDERFLDWLEKHLQKGGDSRACVLTYRQSELQRDLPVSRQWLTALRGLGFQIMLDHFSGDPEAWHCLEKLPVDIVKLAPSLTLDLHKLRSVATALASQVNRLHDAGVKVLVGFVEDASTLPLLYQQRIDLVQGFFLASPETDMNFEFSGL